MTGEDCESCGKFVEGFEYEFCCSGMECGCLGLPIAPCVCSAECYEKLYPNHGEYKIFIKQEKP